MSSNAATPDPSSQTQSTPQQHQDPSSAGGSGTAHPPINEGDNQDLDPVTAAVLVSCNKSVEDFRSQTIAKAIAIANIHTVLKNAIPDDNVSFNESFSHFVAILDNHDQHLEEAHQRGRRDRSESPDPAPDQDPNPIIPSVKRVRLDDSQFPWVISNTIYQVILSPSLTRTLELLEVYGADLKATRRSLMNSPSCLEFPDSEWTNVLSGQAVNLDNVLSGYFSTSNNDEHVEVVGDLEIKFGTVAPTKTVSNGGEWSIAWNRTAKAITTAFPHHGGELAAYAEFIVGLFAATDSHFHDQIIFFDKATAHMDSIGVNVTYKPPPSNMQRAIPTARRKQEACNRWYDGLCTLEPTQCRRLHICNKCSTAGHKSPDCTTA
ncbi:hypothetical protein Hypma_004712 [Hypsizygus marmoreus]|uniref:CCHC-type domain-containing protein n=1 Tax=Hypsizygus marmoreus TaxID=39966 RepID=A0A369J4G6_HYPMA|nr:hypothetical protein Hypma_004712 [Hypsizygus marmoreus]